MPLPLGGVVEVRWNGRWQNQKIMMTHHYHVVNTAGNQGVQTEVFELAQALTNPLTEPNVHSRYMAVMPNDYELEYVDVQAITPLRFAYRRIFRGTPGGVQSPGIGIVTARLTFATLFGGAGEHATKQIGPLPTSAYEDGNLSNGYQNLLNDLGLKMLENVVTTAGPVTFEPCIFDRQNGIGKGVSLVRIQPITGGQRRRVLGVGE